MPCRGKVHRPRGDGQEDRGGHGPGVPGAELAWNPEFLRESTPVADTLSPERIVAGVCSREAEETLRQVYATPLASGSSFFVTDLETSELAKAANAFLAHEDLYHQRDGRGLQGRKRECQGPGPDHRGRSAHRPRVLVGGARVRWRMPAQDIRAFTARAEELGVDNALSFLHGVDSINLCCQARTADLTLEMAGNNLTDVPVAVLGAAFKPGSDDVRDSPALDVAQILHGMGARVTVYDPAARAHARRTCPQLRYAGSVTEAARDAHMLLLLTEWPEFSALRPDALGGVVKHRRLIDARNVLDPGPWHAAGWHYRGLVLAVDQVGARSLYREITNLGE